MTPPKPIQIEIAPGELVDKITILEIKCARIADPGKLSNVRIELESLTAARDRAVRFATASMRQYEIGNWPARSEVL